MTTGQRIAQKRKELGVSQEALGEKLSVSRQSIYKWESDSALPEIEKLIVLSRLFGVSVGWLLGVEEKPLPGETELTEAQVKMVEELAARYASKPRLSPRRLAAAKVSIAAAAVCLCCILYGFYQRLEDLARNYAYLQTSVAQVQSGVDRQISGISGRVEEILKAQNDLTADYGTYLVDVDPSASSASFQVYAVPKNYVEGMRAEFYEGSGSRSGVFGAEEGPGQRFEAGVKCGLLEDITLAVTFIYPDETRQTQILDTYRGLYGQTFPEAEIHARLDYRDVRGGALALSEKDNFYLDWTGFDTAAASNSAVPAAELETLRVGLFKNKKLVDWAVFTVTPGVVEEETAVLTGEQWKALDSLKQKFGDGSKSYESLTLYFPTQEVPLEAGDVIQTAVVIRDIYGRTAVRAGAAYGLDESWSELTALDLDTSDTYPGGWMLTDGSSIA